MNQPFASYELLPYYDEMFEGRGKARTHYSAVLHRISRMGMDELKQKDAVMQAEMVSQGITFTVYSSEPDKSDQERTIPFDLLPRLITAEEWQQLEKGLQQRTRALNRFISDIYHEQHILNDGLIPRDLVLNNPYYVPAMAGLDVPNDVYIPLSGIDLVRGDNGQFYVLEDNLRTPSGLSYIYKNREMMRNLFPELYFDYRVRDIDPGMNALLSCLRSMAPSSKADPCVVLLTPGSYNSAYYDHSFLAQEMGIQLVEPHDLTVINRTVYVKTRNSLRQVDVIYRRIDDEFLDPLAFRKDSLLGVPGLMDAYIAGNVALANAPGTGVADDKAVYAYVPDMIRYYLNEEPIINNVPTYILSRPHELEFVLSRLPEMVVKERCLSGGYGMLIGPTSTDEEIKKFREKIILHPERYIAQPTVKLSCSPSLAHDRIAPRHIDLRAFVFTGDNTSYAVPGGLTRVALQQGSLVVNSSQGGGTKDTWVLTSSAASRLELNSR
ncbi:circularly permuted type 2 ATP-grasp protein [Paenibacillus protaetiae]|uniref:Circularly permuted type 2 ATP-grasp protein n=2 Tax=Paenibacillus protaetiae TaxID=2509456 RepID=A0A4P6EZB8_9BACL|nr:circularly permuted type 2 ATP-grasp protein [Paenibacillus protaetiae]